MRVAFVVNHEKTQLWHGVATILATTYGINTYWISPSLYWTRWLLDKGVKEDQILDTSRIVTMASGSSHMGSDTSVEQRCLKGITANRIILADRLLRSRGTSFAYKYLGLLRETIHQFVTKNDIRIAFGEATWAIELMVNEVMKSIGGQFAKPHTIRIPYDRFAFFDGVDEKVQLVFGDRAPKFVPDSSKLVDTFRARPFKPAYFTLNNQRSPIPSDWYRQLIKWASMEFYDQGRCLTRPSVTTVCKSKLIQTFRRRLMVGRRHFVSELPEQTEFVLYTLHKQPEASIDVLGKFFTDQIEIVRNIARCLPEGTRLVVKEHPNCMGERNRGFYSAISSIPGVVLADPFLDGFSLLKRARAVLTVSGTIAFEAGLLGLPAFTFADMFFSRLPSVRVVSSWEELDVRLNDLLRGRSSTPEISEVVIELATILNKSHAGIISDPRSDKTCMTEENLVNVAEGFSIFVRGYYEGAPPWTR